MSRNEKKTLFGYTLRSRRDAGRKLFFMFPVISSWSAFVQICKTGWLRFPALLYCRSPLGVRTSLHRPAEIYLFLFYCHRKIDTVIRLKMLLHTINSCFPVFIYQTHPSTPKQDQGPLLVDVRLQLPSCFAQKKSYPKNHPFIDWLTICIKFSIVRREWFIFCLQNKSTHEAPTCKNNLWCQIY